MVVTSSNLGVTIIQPGYTAKVVLDLPMFVLAVKAKVQVHTCCTGEGGARPTPCLCLSYSKGDARPIPAPYLLYRRRYRFILVVQAKVVLGLPLVYAYRTAKVMLDLPLVYTFCTDKGGARPNPCLCLSYSKGCARPTPATYLLYRRRWC